MHAQKISEGIVWLRYRENRVRSRQMARKHYMDMKLENPCLTEKDSCVNCHSHFKSVRPFIKSVVISKHFFRDLKDKEEVGSIVKDVLDCSNADFVELHKFEENVDGNLIFRARREGTHIVYCVDKKMRIIFLRAFKNYSEYGKLLDDKNELKKMIASA